MANFLSILVSLGFKAENTALFLVLILFYILFRHKFELLSKDNKHIKETLSNHITDTNKKIEKVDSKIDKLDSKFDSKIDKLDSKFDSKFDKIISLLIKK